MTIQDILDNKEREIQIVLQVINHPAGFDLDLFGHMLNIGSTNSNWEVTWEELLDDQIVETYKEFFSVEEAARFFVEKRHDLQLGIDFEEALMKEQREKQNV